MPISFQCGCGRTLRVKEELAGRKIRCPQCSSILTAPQPNVEYDSGDVSITDVPNAEIEADWDEPEEPASTAITERPLSRPAAPVKKRRLTSKRERKKESWRPPMLFINGEVPLVW